MYAIHFRRGYRTQKDFATMATNLHTLEEAKNKRGTSGDLVVYQKTGIVVDSQEWLEDWEKKDKNCYAQKAIRYDNPKSSKISRAMVNIKEFFHMLCRGYFSADSFKFEYLISKKEIFFKFHRS